MEFFDSNRIKIYVMFGGGYTSDNGDICTAAKCARHGLMEIVDALTDGGTLLYPFAEICLTAHDKEHAETKGLYVIDAPWEILQSINAGLPPGIRRRRLDYVKEMQGPYIGSTMKISTAGAAAYALHVLGHGREAKELLDVFPWKDSFIRENFREG